MSILRTELAGRIFNTTLLMDGPKALTILAAIGGRIVEGGVVLPENFVAVDHVAFDPERTSMGRIGDRLGRAIDQRGGTPYDVIENIAIIPIEGTLVHKGGYIGSSSGRTSYQGLQTQVVRAARDDRIKGVVFEVDSFGGEAAGAFETSDMIAQLSALKPTLSILTDFAFSAGYLMASAARQVVMPENGGAGSIGAVSMHADISGKLEKDGVKVTVLAAGTRKADGNPFGPLPPEVAERSLARLEAGRQTFAAAVGRYRGKRFTKEQALATEADSYTGKEAVGLGLADALGPGNEAFDLFIREVNRKGN